MLCVAFPTIRQGRHAKRLISELHGWPACSLPPCYTRSVATPSVGFRAERLASPYSCDVFHSLLQAGLSRRFRSDPDRARTEDRRLLDCGLRVRSITNKKNPADIFQEKIEIRPLAFGNQKKLLESLKGATAEGFLCCFLNTQGYGRLSSISSQAVVSSRSSSSGS